MWEQAKANFGKWVADLERKQANHASLVAAWACLSDSQRAEEARGLLNRASALIDETGAKAFEVMMSRVRARAREENNLAPPSRL